MTRRTTPTAGGHRRPRGAFGGGPSAVLAGVGILLVCAVLVIVATVLMTDGHGGGSSQRRDARGPANTARTPTTPGPISSTTAQARRWLAVLAGIDRRRELAWRLGRPDLLTQVYAVGVAELHADQRRMTRYGARGLRVSGVTMSFRSIVAQRVTPGSATLVVVDQLGPAVAVDGSGGRHRLPRDVPTRHRIRLRLVGGQWRIAAISPA